MIKLVCQICNKEFWVHNYRIKTAKFCSYGCMGVSQRGKMRGQRFQKGQKPWNKGAKLDRTKYPNMGHFQKHSEKSKKQMGKTRKGKYTLSNSPLWKGGKILQTGYWYIKQPLHARANGNGYVKNSIVVMEKKLGRSITPIEIVHHKNGIKTDDRPTNLKLFKNQSGHSRYHGFNP